MGILIQKGVYDLWQSAPIPEWQGEGDPRQAIRIGDIMRMSSGLRCRNLGDPGDDPNIGYPDHLYLYTGTVNSFEWAAGKDQQWEPDTVGRYRNCDPVLTNYLVRLGVEGELGENYHQFPQRHLFDKLGMRNFIAMTDPYGNFLLQGYGFGSGRDWARLGNLYLTDGVVNGERILPEGYVEYASTLAPAWEADGRHVYGGAFFLGECQRRRSHPDERLPHGGRRRPEHGHHPDTRHGGGAHRALQWRRTGGRALDDALRLLMEAVPAN